MGVGVLVELARPVTLLGCILSLLLVFHDAFLGSETDIRERIYRSLGMLALAAIFALLSGLFFRQDGGEPLEPRLSDRRRPRTLQPSDSHEHVSARELLPEGHTSRSWRPDPGLRLVARHGKPLYAPVRELRLTETFPVQVFFWATSIMAVLFLLSWFLETYVMHLRG